MQDIIETFFKSMGTAGVSEVAKKVGGKNTAVRAALRTAIPLLLAGMLKNATTTKGAKDLTDALKEDHDGSILDDVSKLGKAEEIDGQKILKHVFGDQLPTASKAVEIANDLDRQQVQQLLTIAAPLLMGYLGKKVQEDHLSADTIQDALKPTDEKQQSALSSIVTKLLDKDGDGQIVDDLLGFIKGN